MGPQRTKRQNSVQTMGCCQAKQIKDKDKDEPLLQEHLSSKDNKLNEATIIESTTIKDSNDKIKEDTLIQSKKEIKQIKETTEIKQTKEVKEVKEVKGKKEVKEIDKNKEDGDNEESIAPIKINKNKLKKKRSKHKKRDSRIDVKDLMKFDNFTKKKMDEKKVGKIIKLKIKSMDTQFPLFKVEIDENLNISDLKNKIYEQSPDKIASLRQRLIHKGRLLKDVRTLKQYNILDEQTIMLVRSRSNQKRNNNKHNNKKRPLQNDIGRQRAMTLGSPNPMIQRSATPEPQQISQIY